MSDCLYFCDVVLCVVHVCGEWLFVFLCCDVVCGVLCVWCVVCGCLYFCVVVLCVVHVCGV